jgi:tRNA pseudouridine13 synthase
VTRLKATPEDFLVEEVPLYAPAGAGDHAWVEVEKRLRTTDEVAGELAAAAGADPSRVGWAGRKDREAVTRQWLSVPGLTPERATALAGDGWRVLQAAAHGERLRLGELVGNRFTVVLRDVTAAQAEAAMARLAELVAHGMPNRFGAQRHGTSGENPRLGARLLRGEAVAGGRRLQRLYLSALQAAIFDEALAQRPAPPHRVLAGDLVEVLASGALLTAVEGGVGVHELATLQARADRGEASPTGPILGHKMRAPVAATLVREKEAAARWGIPWVTALPRLRGHQLPGTRRPLRAPLRDLEQAHDATQETLTLRFLLPPGSYATVLVEELFPELRGRTPEP